MGRERFLFLPFPPVGPPFGILTYPVGRVGVIHPSAWKGHSQKFGRFLCALTHILLQSTDCLLAQEYAAFVVWPSECHVTAQDSHLHLLPDLGPLPEDRKDLPFGA
jgi:hypothetical protein